MVEAAASSIVPTASFSPLSLLCAPFSAPWKSMGLRHSVRRFYETSIHDKIHSDNTGSPPNQYK